MDIKAVAFDLDGTLLHSEKIFTERTTRMIRTLEASNIIPIVATGRGVAKAQKFYNMLGIDTPLICYNGACVYDVKGNKDLYVINIDPVIAEEIFRCSKDFNIAFHAYKNHQLLYEKPYSMSNPFDLSSGVLGSVVEFDAIEEKVFTKALYIGDQREIDKAKACLEQMFPNRLSMTYSWPGYLEIVDAKANKRVGLSHVLHTYGISPEHTMAFGDAENDIDMLVWVGHGVAMENAMEPVKQAVLHRAGACDDDGVARYIERYLIH